jgi:plastocyanin
MTRRYLALAGVLAAVGLVAAGCGSKSSSSTPPPASTTPPTTSTADSSGGTLDGTVGPGFTISLTKGGAAVTTLTAGTYTLNVDDQADIHNFHLTGSGVDVSTDVSFKGKKSFTITLKAGKYHYQCDPHSSSMNGDFTVS